MEISAVDVKKLRDRTGMPFGKCREALLQTGGDMDKAVVFLREKNKDVVVKLGERETAEGRIGVYIDPAAQVGAIVEVRCESAPVAKSELFVKLANDLAKQVALKEAASPEALLTQPAVDDPGRTVNDLVGDVVGLLRENIKVARMARMTGVLGSYVHHDGTLGVLLQAEGKGGDAQMLREVSAHIAAMNPVAAVREQVPQATVDQEMAIARAQATEQGKGKPANIIDKIAEGKLKTWFGEKVLAEQAFVKDSSKTVGQVLAGAGLKPVKFVRYKVGELT